MNHLQNINESNATQSIIPCKLLLYYAEEPSEKEKDEIRDRIGKWSNAIHGQGLVEEYASSGSWELIFVIWLSKAIAGAVVGWSVKRGLDKVLPTRSGQVLDKKHGVYPNLSSPVQEGTVQPDQARDPNYQVYLGELLDDSDGTVEEKCAEIGKIRSYLPPNLQPTRITFFVDGGSGSTSTFISIDELGNVLHATGQSSEYMLQRAEEITFPKKDVEKLIDADKGT